MVSLQIHIDNNWKLKELKEELESRITGLIEKETSAFVVGR